MIKWDWLDSIAAEKRIEWDQDTSTRFVIIDGMMEPGVCDQLADFSAIESKAAGTMRKSHKHVRGKSGNMNPAKMTDLQRQFFADVNSERFIKFIEKITGISPLYADPNLQGGGLHQIRSGGYLNVHTDFNFDPETKRNRRLNLLLYLNNDWNEAWGGEIELWDEALDRPFFSAQPISNRVLIFETTEVSYHGHPVPLRTPPGIQRKSLAVYYYSDWPENLEYRADTGYQLTRAQWATLIQRVAGIMTAKKVDEEQVVSELETDYQTGDIRTAYKTLAGLRSKKTRGEPVWEAPDGSLTLVEPK